MEERYLPVFEEADEGNIPVEKKKKGMVHVVLVQCACCAVLVLFFLAFSLFGGKAYEELRGAFANALENNALMATVAELFEHRAPDEVRQVSDGTSALGTTTTAVTTATTTASTSHE